MIIINIFNNNKALAFDLKAKGSLQGSTNAFAFMLPCLILNLN